MKDRRTEAERSPAIPLRRKIAYSFLTTVLFFTLVELLLLALGVSPTIEREDPFRGFSGHVSVFEKDTSRGVYTSDREAVRETFNPQEFRIEKPPGGFRVFCLGGSSAYGFPWGAEAAFPAVPRRFRGPARRRASSTRPQKGKPDPFRSSRSGSFAEKVWRALTDPVLLAEWLLPVYDLELEPGAAFRFKTEPYPGWDGTVNCRFLEIEAHRRLSYSWVVGDMEIDTVVTFTLTPTASGTRLSLVQSGFKPDQEQAFGGARYGWKMMGGKLVDLLARIP